MRKTFLFICSALLCALLLSAAVFAAEGTTVYVADGGTGDGSSAASPLGSLSAAVNALQGKGGTVIACGEVSFTSIVTVPEQSGDLTITAENGGKLCQGSRLQFAKNTNDNRITIDLPIDITTSYPVFIFGGFNNMHFTEKCVVTSVGGSNARLHFMGGVLAESGGSNAACITKLPYSITVDGGSFYMFSAGNYRSSISAPVGSISAPVEITISGGTFGKAGDYDTVSNNKNYWDISISGAAILADDATLNISGGRFEAPIFAQGRLDCVPAGASEASALTASDRNCYAADGDVAINITGGTFNGKLISAYYTQAGYTQLLRGNFNVNISGTPTFAAGTVIDATQVKAYAGENKQATLTYPTSLSLTAKRFDVVNGEAQTYDEPLRVAFIGDSITEGYNAAIKDRLTQAYPAQFLAKAEAAGKEIIVSNYGVSAAGFLQSTSRYYMEMLAYPLVMEECDADYYVIAMGTNDASAIGGTNGALTLFESAYRTVAETLGAKADTERVFITSAIYRKTSSILADLRASAVLHPIQKRIAASLAEKEPDKYVFVDLYQLTFSAAADGSLFAGSSENLHPAESGYGIMADKLYDAIFNGVTEVSDFYRTDVYVSASGSPFGTGTASDPISSLPVAMDKFAPGVEATLHIIGEFTFASNFYGSIAPSKLHIVGEGDGAVLTVSGDAFKLGCDTRFDNLTLKTTSTSGSHIMACYHNAMFTETVKTDGIWHFYAGYNVFATPEVAGSKASAFDTVESASSANDCTITVNGGTWTCFAGGNRRFHAAAPIGVYSGNMTLTVGGKASVVGSAFDGVVGANYLAGSLTANISGWQGTAVIPDFVGVGTLSNGIEYVPANNTGRVSITSETPSSCMGDLDGSGAVDIVDALQMLRGAIGGDFAASGSYFGVSAVTLRDVLWILYRVGA